MTKCDSIRVFFDFVPMDEDLRKAGIIQRNVGILYTEYSRLQKFRKEFSCVPGTYYCVPAPPARIMPFI